MSSIFLLENFQFDQEDRKFLLYAFLWWVFRQPYASSKKKNYCVVTIRIDRKNMENMKIDK